MYLGTKMRLQDIDATKQRFWMFGDAKYTGLTVARQSNPYFADYQPQNSSVFSFYDDLTLTNNGKVCRYTKVNYTPNTGRQDADLCADECGLCYNGISRR